jgi:hypothetical protein
MQTGQAGAGFTLTAAITSPRGIPALPHLERRLGPDHPVTLTLWFSIAREMAAREDHAGAEEEFRDMLPHLQRTLGPDHPDTQAAAEWIDFIQGAGTTTVPEPRPRHRKANDS